MYSIFTLGRAVGFLTQGIGNLYWNKRKYLSLTQNNGNCHCTLGASSVVEWFNHLPGETKTCKFALHVSSTVLIQLILQCFSLHIKKYVKVRTKKKKKMKNMFSVEVKVVIII